MSSKWLVILEITVVIAHERHFTCCIPGGRFVMKLVPETFRLRSACCGPFPASLLPGGKELLPLLRLGAKGQVGGCSISHPFRNSA